MTAPLPGGVDGHFGPALRRFVLAQCHHGPDPVRIATEGAPWGSVTAHGVLPETVIVSDDAG